MRIDQTAPISGAFSGLAHTFSGRLNDAGLDKSLFRRTGLKRGATNPDHASEADKAGPLYAGQPFVCVVMALYHPDPDYLEAQLESLGAQTHVPDLLVMVNADRKSGSIARDLAQAAGLQARVVTPDQELDAVRAFEAGLFAALKETPEDTFYALCDQDDIWHNNRIAAGLEALKTSSASLVHSDARLVNARGKLMHSSMFEFEKRHKNPGLRGLLYLNTVSGMTILMRRRLVEIALPFPAQSGVHYYHDLWLSLLADAMGGVHRLDEVLVDYRQHGKNAVGAQAGPEKIPRPSLRNTNWLRVRAAQYGLARYLAQNVYARMEQAVTDGTVRSADINLNPLRPFLARSRGAGVHLRDAAFLLLTGHMGLAQKAFSFATVNLGRLVWVLRAVLGEDRHQATSRFDDRLYALSPGVALQRSLPEINDKCPRHFSEYIEKRVQPNWRPVMNAAHPSVTVLVPTLNPTEVFAGIATALDIGTGLARLGHHVRFIATDLPVASAETSRNFVLRRLHAMGDASALAQGRITLECGVTSDTVSAHPADRFLATAWWSAHVARQLIDDHGFKQRQFDYLIQDFEPNFYPWGAEFSGSMASYDLSFRPIFNTNLLRDYFASQGFGFADPDALVFRPSIDISRYAGGARPVRKNAPRQLVLYGRPEVPRNMFSTAIEATAAMIRDENLDAARIKVVSVGLKHDDVKMPNGILLRSLGKLPFEDYPGFLLNSDVGLSLMCSPHPSHLPIEMAASGMRVVTNHFGPKNLSQLSGAIVSVDPNPKAVTAGLKQAWNSGPVCDAERYIDMGQLGGSLRNCISSLSETLKATLQDTCHGAGK